MESIELLLVYKLVVVGGLVRGGTLVVLDSSMIDCLIDCLLNLSNV